MHFQAICQASAKNTKPQKLSSRRGENTIFKVSSFKKTTKIQHKKLQNEGAKKHRKNHSKNRFREPFKAPKPSQPLQNRRKINSKSKSKKDGKKSEKKHSKKNPPASNKSEPVLASEREARSS